MITNPARRVVLVIVNLFLAVTAIAGGLGLIFGWIDLPLDWLAAAPFTTYTIPGLILMLVGCCALFAASTVLRQTPGAAAACMLAGSMIMGFEVVEVLMVGSQPGLMRSLQILYFCTGVLIAGLATWPWTPAHLAALQHGWQRPPTTRHRPG